MHAQYTFSNQKHHDRQRITVQFMNTHTVVLQLGEIIEDEAIKSSILSHDQEDKIFRCSCGPWERSKFEWRKRNRQEKVLAKRVVCNQNHIFLFVLSGRNLWGADQDTTTIACHPYIRAGRALKALFSIKITFSFRLAICSSSSTVKSLFTLLQAQLRFHFLSSLSLSHKIIITACVSILILISRLSLFLLWKQVINTDLHSSCWYS